MDVKKARILDWVLESQACRCGLESTFSEEEPESDSSGHTIMKPLVPKSVRSFVNT